MSRVVIDARESGTSTGRYIDKLVEYLAKLKPAHEVIVLTKPHRMEYLQSVAPDFDIRVADFKEFTFAEQLGFKRYIRKLRPDLVHFAKDHQPIFYRGTVITTMHDLTTMRFYNPDKNRLVFEFKQLVYKQVVRRVAHKSAAILTPSEFTKKDVIHYAKVGPSKISVTYLAADVIPDKPDPIIGLKGKQFLMYVGRPTPHKNLERLIDAFIKLRHRTRR